MKRRFSRKIGIISSIVVICLIVGAFFAKIVIPQMVNGSIKVSIFNDISECENLESAEILLTEKYDTPNKDDKLDKLNYIKFYAAKYACDDFEFEIFAYEFENEEIARKYFQNASGRKPSKDTEFFAHGGMISYSMVVIDGINAYSVYTDTEDRYKVSEILHSCFSKSIAE